MNQIITESYANPIRIDPFLMFQQINNEAKTISNSNQINPMIIKNER